MITENVFAEPRKPDDLDLLNEVSKLLENAGHPSPNKWTQSSLLVDAIYAAPKLQRFLINRFWRVSLGNCSENTSKERYCLVDNGQDTVYLQIFKDAIVPSIIKYKLEF